MAPLSKVETNVVEDNTIKYPQLNVVVIRILGSKVSFEESPQRYPESKKEFQHLNMIVSIAKEFSTYTLEDVHTISPIMTDGMPPPSHLDFLIDPQSIGPLHWST